MERGEVREDDSDSELWAKNSNCEHHQKAMLTVPIETKPALGCGRLFGLHVLDFLADFLRLALDLVHRFAHARAGGLIAFVVELLEILFVACEQVLQFLITVHLSASYLSYLTDKTTR